MSLRAGGLTGLMNQSSAQVVDGSLKFNSVLQNYLEKDFSSDGNRKTWTWSSWVKKPEDEGFSDDGVIFEARIDSPGSTDANIFGIRWRTNGRIIVYDTGNSYIGGSREFRDTNAFYHLVLSVDTTQASNNISLYVNGDLYLQGSYTQNSDTRVNSSAATHRIGARTTVGSQDGHFLSSQLSQTYFIDGQALGPEYFGFTDPLTNTWRPKKYTGGFTQSSANDGTTWSSSVSGPVNSSKPLSLLFGGTIGSGYQNGTTPTGGNTLTFDISSKNLIVTNVRLNTFISLGPGGTGTPSTFTVNGTTVPISGQQDQTHVVAVNGQLNTIAWSYDDGNGPYVYMRGIEVDLGGGLGYELLTDGVNNTGVNSFYLPFDGNSLIGQDKSGNGNDWTPVNFGGSVALDNSQVSGARPILNTTQGGTQAGVGYFGSKENKNITVTVASKTGGGNAYFFDSVERDSLALLRGTTIIFDTTDSSNNSHPFKLSSTNADSSGGTEYTDGVAYFVNGSQKNGSDYVSQYANNGGGTGFRGIKWTVPHNVSTTYYYCTVHNGMGEGGRLTSTTDASKADPFAWKCVLALPLVGDAKDISHQINLTSSGKSITVSGAVASSIQTNLYGGSFFFDGSDDFLSVADDTGFTVGSDPFTFEFWAYKTASGEDFFWGSSNSGGQTASMSYSVQTGGGSPSNSLRAHVGDGSSLYTVNSGIDFVLNKWVHIAFVRDGNTLRLFQDGVQVDTTSFSGTVKDSADPLMIGRGFAANSAKNFPGYIQDFRFYKGVAKYTSDFVVPSTSPDVLPDTPSGVSGSSKLAKITGGAVSFEGTAKSKLRVNDSTDFTFGTNDFCIEFYYYNNSLDGTYNIIFDCMDSNRSGIQLAFETDGDYRIEVGDGSGNWIWQSTGFDAKAKKWTHFALTRQGNTFRAFEDGVLLGTQTSSTAVGDPRSPAIGGYASDDSTNYGFNGFISNFRIVNGSAVYTAAFTPSTAPLTNITNTKLLCCQSNKSSAIAAVSPNISGSINNGTAWSSIVTGPTRHQDRVSNAFDGTTSGPGAIPGYPGRLTFAPGFTGLTTVKIYGYYAGSGVTLHVNGSQQSPSSGAFTLTISTSTLDSVVWTAKDGFNYMRIDAIEVDSTVLIDPVVAPDDSNAEATTFNSFITDINTIRGQETGYATLNPLDSAAPLADGNLQQGTSSGWQSSKSTIGLSSGRWYWETQNMQTAAAILGIADETASSYPSGSIFGTTGHSGGDSNPAWTWAGANYYFNATSAGTGLSNHLASDIVQYALDLDAGKLWFGRNGIWYNSSWAGGADPASGTNQTVSITTGRTYMPAGTVYNGGAVWNFGQKPFKFPPPDGFQPINAANVRPETVISRPDQYFGTILYTGSGTTSGREISGLNFNAKPDLIWIKNRGESVDHLLFDSLRGFGANKELTPNDAYSEGQTGTGKPNTNVWGFVKSNNYNGFTVQSGSTGQSVVNNNSIDYVAWAWKAGGNKNTFNIDDVGYANASDVGMNIGGQNGNAYNQTQNWSAGGGSGLYSGSTWGPTFDGTPANDGHNIAHSAYVSNNGTSTLTFSSAISGVLKFRACQGSDSTSSGTSRPYVELSDGQTIRVDGGTSTPSIHSFGKVSNITSLTINGTSAQGMNLIFVELDGKLLVDTSVTPPNVPSIAPSGCSVGTKQGFSIVKYTGNSTANATLPHGLSESPKFVMIKNLSNEYGWTVLHTDVGTTGTTLDGSPEYYMLQLDSNADKDNWSQDTIWNPTLATVKIDQSGGANWINNSNSSYIMYAWHNVPGLQKFGSYEGNNNADGTFVELGFRPALIWVKNIDADANWKIIDARLDTYNPANTSLNIDTTGTAFSNAENNTDILANGFKLRSTHGARNASNTYVYCAWAEAPAFNLYGGQSNAR